MVDNCVLPINDTQLLHNMWIWTWSKLCSKQNQVKIDTDLTVSSVVSDRLLLKDMWISLEFYEKYIQKLGVICNTMATLQKFQGDYKISGTIFTLNNAGTPIPSGSFM